MGFLHVGQVVLKFLTPSHPPALASQSGRITGVSHCAQLFLFVFLVEMGFYLVGQAGLELLTLGDLPASASQSARITGVTIRVACLSNSYTKAYDSNIRNPIERKNGNANCQHLVSDDFWV